MFFLFRKTKSPNNPAPNRLREIGERGQACAIVERGVRHVVERGVRHALLCFIGLALLMQIRMFALCPIDCIDSIKVKPSRVLKWSSIY